MKGDMRGLRHKYVTVGLAALIVAAPLIGPVPDHDCRIGGCPTCRNGDVGDNRGGARLRPHCSRSAGVGAGRAVRK